MYKLLIAEDDRFQRHLLTQLIQNINDHFEVCHAVADGREALLRLEESPVDAVLADIRMPHLSGVELLQQLKTARRDIEVVLISTYSQFEYARQGIIYGAFDYLVKPLDQKTLAGLLTRLEERLAEKRLERQPVSGAKPAPDHRGSVAESKEDEAALFNLLLTDPGRALPFAESLLEKWFNFFAGDLPKAGTFLDTLLSNVQWEIAKRYPWIGNFQWYAQPPSAAYRSATDREHLSALLKQELTKIIEFQSKLHLSQCGAVIGNLCEYLAAHCEGKTTLETVAKRFNFSPDYLGKLFKAETGENFGEFVTKVKLERAKSLIRSGRYKIYEVSALLGYKDSDYFCRLFKEYTGLTPAEYRKSPLFPSAPT